jgi:hypothetical protein
MIITSGMLPGKRKTCRITATSPSKRLSIGLTIRCSKISTCCTERSYKYPENALTNQLTNKNGKQLKEVQSDTTRQQRIDLLTGKQEFI